MTHIWHSSPSFRIEISGQTFINDTALTVLNKRNENNLSYLVLQVDDYQSKNYVDVFDPFDAITLSLRYGSNAWTKVFTGAVSSVKPNLTNDGELLGVGCWGEGRALPKTHCDESYGVESVNNSTVDTPKEIVDDLITNHINKEFGGAASGYAIVSEVDNIHAGLSVTHLNSQYLDNFVNVNRVCSLATAFAAATPGVHWFVDPDKNLMVKEIDQDHTSTNWDRYYGGTQATATLEVAKDMILYDFNKNVEEYANSIVLYSQLRKPAEDYWTENQSGLWDHTAVQVEVIDDNATFLVGAFSIAANNPPGGGGNGFFWYPAAKDAAWDLTKIGSEKTIPTINFYARRNDTLQSWSISLCTNNNDKFNITRNLVADLAAVDTWYHFSFPVGPYYDRKEDVTDFKWTIANNPDWADIDFIEFPLQTTVNNRYVYIDDLHFSGQIVREARDAAEIAANKVHQKVIRNDTAVNDSMKQADDTETAAQLCYAELLRRAQTPIVGMIKIPLLPDLLPGQTVHIHACLKKGYKNTDANAFKIDADFRVKDLRHIINVEQGSTTILNLTNDVTNTHAFGVPSRYTLLKQYAGALAHSEARNLKGGAIDNLIPRLSVNY